MVSPLVFAIRPQFVAGFRGGYKEWEYRRSRPHVEVGDTVLIYETRPTSAIVASAVVHAVFIGTPAEIWAETGHLGGVERRVFDRYFNDRKRGSALHLVPTWLDKPVRLPAGMAPPQSWARLKGPWPPECADVI